MTSDLRADFDLWWAAYPRKVGKLAAVKAYGAARKLATAEELMAGLERYKATKPEYQDWCHPRTWLHQGRWMDEDTPAQKPAKPKWGTWRPAEAR